MGTVPSGRSLAKVNLDREEWIMVYLAAGFIGWQLAWPLVRLLWERRP